MLSGRLFNITMGRWCCLGDYLTSQWVGDVVWALYLTSQRFDKSSGCPNRILLFGKVEQLDVFNNYRSCKIEQT